MKRLHNRFRFLVAVALLSAFAAGAFSLPDAWTHRNARSRVNLRSLRADADGEPVHLEPSREGSHETSVCSRDSSQSVVRSSPANTPVDHLSAEASSPQLFEVVLAASELVEGLRIPAPRPVVQVPSSGRSPPSL
ncbi:MAG: hypothetical protein IRZ15_18155 [Bryobacteraceae bacterium]|nr:hypothetical protein [Bryobacteraceae bacterium]